VGGTDRTFQWFEHGTHELNYKVLNTEFMVLPASVFIDPITTIDLIDMYMYSDYEIQWEHAVVLTMRCNYGM
jgi:hypothetical protein